MWAAVGNCPLIAPWSSLRLSNWIYLNKPALTRCCTWRNRETDPAADEVAALGEDEDEGAHATYTDRVTAVVATANLMVLKSHSWNWQIFRKGFTVRLGSVFLVAYWAPVTVGGAGVRFNSTAAEGRKFACINNTLLKVHWQRAGPCYGRLLN